MAPYININKFQPTLRHINCFDWTAYPFILLNFIGLIIHIFLLIGIGIGKLTGNLFQQSESNLDEFDSEDDSEDLRR